MSEPVRLQNAIWSLGVLPEKGACISMCECQGRPVFRPADLNQIEAGDIFASSCFPMIPYSNRIADGAFAFGDRNVNIRRNHPDHIFPIHGNVWEKPWSVEHATETQCELSLTYKPEADGWPWAFQANQNISIDGPRLSFHLEIKNTDAVAFPVGLGLHPFFANRAIAEVKFRAEHIWMNDERLIPVQRLDLPSRANFSSWRKIEALDFDNCFEGWAGHAEIKWADLPGVVRMDTGSEFSSLVVYIDPNNDFFCLEPATHVNNALNHDVTESLTVLSPNESLTGDVILSHVVNAEHL